jgi:hypothetical protein
MKAITIIQPFAEMIARGDKRVENRSWHTPYRGPLAIHAGRATRYGGEPVRAIALDYDIDPASLILGAVIATARLADCVRLCRALDGSVRPTPPAWAVLKYPWLAEHEHTEGPYCWVLEDVRRIDPVPIGGAQGLWEWRATP